MNTTARTRRSRTTTSQRIAELERKSDALLSALNIVLLRYGKLRIRAAELENVPRRRVEFVIIPPDPDVAGSEEVYEISLEGSPVPLAEPKGPSLLDRLGFWRPR
jgi:hypothetical protein